MEQLAAVRDAVDAEIEPVPEAKDVADDVEDEPQQVGEPVDCREEK